MWSSKHNNEIEYNSLKVDCQIEIRYCNNVFPTILQLGPITISSLGVMVALSFFFSSFLIWKKAKEENYDEEMVMDGIILVTIVSFLVSRTWFILENWQQLGGHLLVWFNFVSKPGFSWFGSLIGGILALKLFCQKQKWNFFKMVDLVSFGLCLGAIFLQIGYFFDGSSYGMLTSLPWGLTFPGLDQPRHPTQIYELVLLILILRLLYFFDKHYRTYEWYKNKRGEAAPGFLFLVFLAGFCLTKFTINFLKDHGLFWGWHQLTSLLLFFLSLVMLYFRSGEGFKVKTPIFVFNKTDKLDKINNIKIKRKRVKTKFHFKTGVDAK